MQFSMMEHVDKHYWLLTRSVAGGSEATAAPPLQHLQNAGLLGTVGPLAQVTHKAGVQRVAGVGGVSGVTQRRAKAKLGLRRVHDRDQPIPRRPQTMLQVHLQ